MSGEYKGGFFAPTMTQPQALVAYIKGDKLIVTVASPAVPLPEALWALEGWANKIVSEIGYKLVMGVIIESHLIDGMYRLLDGIASDNGLHIVRQSDWQG